MSSPANFNGLRPVIDVNDSVMLLIDHQSGLFQTVGDMPMPELRARAAALAKMATLAKMPVITTASVPQGPNGPLIPEIHANAPHAQYIARKGEINAWDNEDFVKAVKATGRKTLIIAGTITSVCMAFPAISAVAEGYKVFAVIDASGTYSKMAQEITLARYGEVSEWLKEHAWKVCIRQRIGGSNPPLTAIFKKELVRKYGLFAYMYPPNQGGMRTTDRGSTQKRRERF